MECIGGWQCMLGPVDVVGGDESSFPGLRGEQEIIATFLPDILPSTCVLFDTSQYHCGWSLLEVGKYASLLSSKDPTCHVKNGYEDRVLCPELNSFLPHGDL